MLGSPELPGQPLAARAPNSEEALERSPIGQLLARVEAHLAENPNDGRGWEVVAPVYMKLERYDDAAKARRQAILLLGETPARDVDLGEAITAAANGVISDEAKVAFDRAIKLDAENYKAQFYLGLAAEQDGNMAEASRIWQGLIANRRRTRRGSSSCARRWSVSTRRPRRRWRQIPMPRSPGAAPKARGAQGGTGSAARRRRGGGRDDGRAAFADDPRYGRPAGVAAPREWGRSRRLAATVARV